MPLYKVEVTGWALVEAHDEREARNAALGEWPAWRDSGGTSDNYAEVVEEIRTREQIPPTWRGSLPFRAKARRDEDDRTCEDVVALRREELHR